MEGEFALSREASTSHGKFAILFGHVPVGQESYSTPPLSNAKPFLGALAGFTLGCISNSHVLVAELYDRCDKVRMRKFVLRATPVSCYLQSN